VKNVNIPQFENRAHTLTLLADNKHNQIVVMNKQEAKVPFDTFVAPDATLIGNVQVANKASIWYNCVLDGM
jgi:hypothetical protein